MKRFIAAAPAALALSLGLDVASAQAPHDYTEDAIALLGESIAFRTVEGAHMREYADFLKERLVAGGFDAADISVEESEGSAILVATYRGSGAKGPIVLSAHMDVVSANPEDWTRDPFTMVRENGYLYGRGTSDNKFGLTMLVTTLIRLKQEGFAPNRDLILAFSGDEETNMKTTQVLADRLKDAEIVLNSDGGGGALDEGGNPVAYSLQAAEKTYADFLVTFTNPGGHSSLPRDDNAIYDLAAAAVKVAQYKFPVQWSDITLGYFKETGARTEGPLGEAMLRFAEKPGDKKAARTIAERPEFVGQLGTTCVATMLDAGHAQNALPQRASMNVNCRIFPGVAVEDVRQTLVDVIDNPAVTVELTDPANAADASPLRDDVVAAVSKAVHERYPDLAIVPQMSAGATDSLHFRARGVPSYGVAGLFMKASDEYAHGLNERVPEDAVGPALEHWHSILKTLASD